MNSEQPNFSGSSDADLIVDAAIAALRDVDVPEGPSTEVIAKTRGAISALTPSPLYSGELVSVRGDFADGAAQSITPRSGPLPRVRGRGSLLLHPPTFMRIAALLVIGLAAAIIYRLAAHHANPSFVDSVNHGPAVVVRPIPPVAPTPHVETPAAVPTVTPPAEAGPPQVADGSIVGQVTFAGIAPRPMPLPGVELMPNCEKLHGGPIYDESLVVDANGGMANVVVSISSGLSGWLREEFPPPAEAVLNQRGCVFEPHVVAIMVGAPLLIKNSDPMLHNVHVMAVNNPEANLGQPTIGELAGGPFESPEVFRVKCDVHPWMQAWVRVVDNPFFAVTGRDGRFTLHGLPPGTYTLKAWHEQLGVREMQITISAGKGAEANFLFRPMGS